MTDDELDDLLREASWARLCRPLTPEEAQRAYDEAPDEPLTPERIEEIVAHATGKGPSPKRPDGEG